MKRVAAAKKKAPAKRVANSARKPKPSPRGRSRRNPAEDLSGEEAAAALSEAFHGRPAHEARDYVEEVAERQVLTDLGRLIELRVWLDEDDYIALKPKAGVRVACSPDGGQIYFVGGDQAVELDAIGLEKSLPKDHLALGACDYICYHTSKDFHDFEPVDYEHQFGEETGDLPILNYDVLNKRLFLTGGSYQVKRAGIVN
ncbi:MAG TPA: hypothetical protein VFA28_01900 [Bryobacteraceae bacterium]|jgi:hypothetical protein|nr:hypothetical protein [Bryobacteraceae bacterium]